MAIRKDWPASRIREFAGMGMNLNATNRDGATPLFLAFALRRDELVRVLLELGASEFLCTRLTPQPGSVESLVHIRDSGRVNHTHLARYACAVLSNDDDDVVQLSHLLEVDGVAAELARMDAEAESRSRTRLSPIYVCSYHKSDEAFNLILRSGCRDLGCDERDRTAIHILAARGRTGRMRALAEHDRERLARAINQPASGDYGTTALHKSTSVKTSLELLRLGADPRALDGDGEACEDAWLNMEGGVRLLMAEGVLDRAGEIIRKFIENNKEDMMDPAVADGISFPAVPIVNLVEARVRGLAPSPEEVDELLTRMLGMKANRLGRVLQLAASSSFDRREDGGIRSAIFRHVLTLRGRYPAAIEAEHFLFFHSDMSALDADMAEALVACVGPAVIFSRQPLSSSVIRALESPEMLRRMFLYRSGELVTADDAAVLYSRAPSRAIPDPARFFEEHFGSRRLQEIGVVLAARSRDWGEGSLVDFLRDFASVLDFDCMEAERSLVRRLASIEEPQLSRCLEVLPERGNAPVVAPGRRPSPTGGVRVWVVGADGSATRWPSGRTIIERIWNEVDIFKNPEAKAALLRNSTTPLCPIEDVIFHVHPEGSWWELLHSVYPPADVCAYMRALEKRGDGFRISPGPHNMCPTLDVPNFFSRNPCFPLVRNVGELWIALRYCFPDDSRRQALRILIVHRHIEPRKFDLRESQVEICCSLFAPEIKTAATLTSLDADTVVVIHRPYVQACCSLVREAWDRAKIGKGQITWRVWNRVIRSWTGVPLEYLRDDFWELDAWTLKGTTNISKSFKFRTNRHTHT